MLSTTLVTAVFNDIAHRIYGSQLKLLLLLASVPSGTGISTDKAQELFLQSKELHQNIHHDRTFEVWLQYLTVNELISISENKK